MKKNRFFTLGLLSLLSVVLLGCPTAAPEAKKKGGDDGGDGDKGYVCPAYTGSVPTDGAALKTLVNDAITINPLADLNHIDVSGVNDMSRIFNGKSTFNGNISCWDTSSVEHMNNMFNGAKVFTGDIKTDGNKWNTSNVKNMNLMFYEASKFNGDISQWNTVEVTNMDGIFWDATTFDQDLSGWDVKNVLADKHAAFASGAGFKDDTATKHPKWCDNATGSRYKSCGNFP